MPSKSLSKVQKHVTARKGKNPAIHENSRDSKRLRTASARDDKLHKLASVRAKLNQPHLDRVAYFQTAAEERSEPFTEMDLHALIQSFIQRYDEELEKLKAERRPGRPATTRQDLLTQNKSLEEKEYVSGFWIPEILEDLNLSSLRDWTGEWGSLNTLRFSRLAKDGTMRTSSFPPKGMS